MVGQGVLLETTFAKNLDYFALFMVACLLIILWMLTFLKKFKKVIQVGILIQFYPVPCLENPVYFNSFFFVILTMNNFINMFLISLM